MLAEQTAEGAAGGGNALGFEHREEGLLFLAVMTLVGEDAKELDQTGEQSGGDIGTGGQAGRENIHAGDGLLDDAVLEGELVDRG